MTTSQQLTTRIMLIRASVAERGIAHARRTDRNEPVRSGQTCIQRRDAGAEAMTSDGLCVLAFRGMEPTQLTDLGAGLAFTLTDRAEKAGRVHEGFAGAARSVLAELAGHDQALAGGLRVPRPPLGSRCAEALRARDGVMTASTIDMNIRTRTLRSPVKFSRKPWIRRA